MFGYLRIFIRDRCAYERSEQRLSCCSCSVAGINRNPYSSFLHFLLQVFFFICKLEEKIEHFFFIFWHFRFVFVNLSVVRPIQMSVLAFDF
ncbi:hypothetical protein N665_0738s0019 [Sinapis alba]|nr:hypothetical protein N665_0738s0019 [Sinapis alba]